MYILWQPEKGECKHCNDESSYVRRFTADTFHTMFCFDCWKKVQGKRNNYNICVEEWEDNLAFTFEFTSSDDLKNWSTVLN